MKSPKANLTFVSVAASLLLASAANGHLIITGIGDGPLSGGTPKFVELFVAADIADLSVYTLQNFNNGGSTASTTFSFTGSAMGGSYLYVATESANFTSFFGFSPTYVSSVMTVNGDDALALNLNATLVDVYGQIGVDGTTQFWEYLDGSSVRKSQTGPSATFVQAEWTFNGVDSLEGGVVNSSVTVPFQIGTYKPIPEPATSAMLAAGTCLLLCRLRARRNA